MYEVCDLLFEAAINPLLTVVSQVFPMEYNSC